MSSTNVDDHIPPNIPDTVAALQIKPELPILRNYIDGAFQTSTVQGDVVYIENVNPATGHVISYLPRSTAEDVDAAVRAAHEAHVRGEWRLTSNNHRASVLEKIADLIQSHLEEFAQLETLDTGKPITLSRTVDIPRAVDNFRFFAAAVRSSTTESSLMQGQPVTAVNYTQRSPVGVCSLIAPWNLPLYLMTWKIAPCLAMGNTCVAKPSEFTSSTLHFLAQLIHQHSLLPRGVLNVVFGFGADVGAPMCSHPLVHAVSFTGGTVTGQKVAVAAASSFKKMSLELGGKNATLVFSDCNLEETVAGTVRAAFTNTGQVCLCGSRILVERPIYEMYVSKFVAAVKQLKCADPMLTDSNCGSVISAPHARKLEVCVQRLVRAGAKVQCGGQRFGHAFFAPTVVTDADHACVCSDEYFGPIVTIHPFDSQEEAIRMVNASRYGLSATVWTTNLQRAHVVSHALEVGMVWVNCWLVRDLRVPFGGVKESGVGREGGHYSMRFFSEDKNVCIKL
jgi:aminomuconate-semialdehyde/2-hydroxymuconate-6-semialdehyde dehydrogenase